VAPLRQAAMFCHPNRSVIPKRSCAAGYIVSKAPRVPSFEFLSPET
jgi:hypothetical protein